MKTNLSLPKLLKFTRTCGSQVPTVILFLILFALSPAPLALSQIPEGFNYQAIARDDSGEILANKDMVVIIELLAGSESGTLIWQESHAVTSDQFGLISLIVGNGTRTGGLPAFTDIDWSAQTVFLKTTVEYPVGTPHVMGTAQIWAVPYSLVAKDVEGPVQKLGIEGTTTNDEEALFEVRNKDGQVVFAVYNEGIRAYVNEIDEKGAKGGFAIGSFGTTKEGEETQDLLFVSGDSVRVYIDNADVDPIKGPKGGFAIGGFGAVKGLNQKYFMVSNDSVRIYIDNADADKGPKGGFAIGGYGAAKGKPQDLLTVSNDSVRIYIDEAGTDKGVKGGFAIGGFGTVKGSAKFMNVTPDSTRIYTGDSEKGFGVGNISTGVTESYLKLTPQNYFIGHEAGKKNIYNEIASTGEKNIFIGYQAGRGNISGKWNTFLGYQAGMVNTGSDNTFIGYLAGNAHQGQGGNVYIGSKAGQYATNGQQNVLIGESVGANITSGSYNVLLGFESGKNTGEGAYNVFLGYQAGYTNDDGKMNVFIGYNAGLENIGGDEPAGDYNIALGAMAGEKNQSGSHNVFLGQYSGRNNTTGSENVYIGSNAGSFNNKSQNTFVGTAAGYMNQTGDNNVFMGYFSGGIGTSGSSNTFVGAWSGYQSTGSNNSFFGNATGFNNTGTNNSIFGFEAGASNTSGSNNTFFGYKSGTSNAQGNYNSFFGYESGYSNQSTDGNNGSGNTYIGYKAGRSNSTGVNNIFIGQYAGYSESGSEKLIINNSFSDPPLIYGEFNNDLVRLNATVNIRDMLILDGSAVSVTTSSGFIVIPSKSNILLTAPEASILNTTTPVANGTAVGQILILRGSDETNTITIQDSGNVNLSGQVILGTQDSLMLMWDGTSWIQIAGANNN